MQAIDDARNAVLDQGNIEIDQQTQSFVSQPQVRRLGRSPGNGYSTRQAAYDIRKLRGKQMIEKRPYSHRYQAVPDGLRAIAAVVLLRDKVIRPLLAAQGRPRRGRPPGRRTPIDLRYAALQREMRGLFEELGLAA